MAKYMVSASYTVEGTKGLLKDGGSGRRAAVHRRPALRRVRARCNKADEWRLVSHSVAGGGE